MPTGLPVENSCLAANPWVTFSSQFPLCLRPSPLLCQLWWEAKYAKMAERLDAAEREVETVAVEGTGSVRLEGRTKGSLGLATTGVDGVYLWRTKELHVMVKAKHLHSSRPVGKKSPEQTYLQLFTQQRYPHPLLLATKGFSWIKSTFVFDQGKQKRRLRSPPHSYLWASLLRPSRTLNQRPNIKKKSQIVTHWNIFQVLLPMLRVKERLCDRIKANQDETTPPHLLFSN